MLGVVHTANVASSTIIIFILRLFLRLHRTIERCQNEQGLETDRISEITIPAAIIYSVCENK